GLEEGMACSTHFEFAGQQFDLPGYISKKTSSSKSGRIGISFGNLSRSESRKLKRCLTALELLEYSRRPQKTNAATDFSHWLMTFLRTGKGLLPETSQVSRE